MSDTIPDEFMKAAQDLVAAEQIRFASAYGTVITDSRTVEVIARALMAAAKEADEAATKRERERAAKYHEMQIEELEARLAAALTAIGMTEAQLEGLANGTMVLVPVEQLELMREWSKPPKPREGIIRKGRAMLAAKEAT